MIESVFKLKDIIHLLLCQQNVRFDIQVFLKMDIYPHVLKAQLWQHRYEILSKGFLV